MSSSALLRLDRLSLLNFRCFTDCTVELHPELVVLVAENGRGKTAILDAVKISLGLFVDTIAGTNQVPGFTRTDVRLVQEESGVMAPALPTQFLAEGFVIREPMRWSRARIGYVPRSRTTKKEAEGLRHAAMQLRQDVEVSAPMADGTAPVLPLVAFYGTDRIWNGQSATKAPSRLNRTANRRFDGYSDCLSLGSSFRGLIDWYQQKAFEIRDPTFSTDLPANLRLLAAVKEAMRVVLEPTQWSDLEWDFERSFLVVKHPEHGCLPLSALSDGVRNTIALIADIARRCATLNPHMGDFAAVQTPGVLLIDEVDMHLHPRWQQLVIGLLQAAFPALQMILSTHSPHVLSTVDVASVRVITLNHGHGESTIPAFQTRGVESADVLARVMEVDPVPQVEQARWLTDYRAMVQESEYESPDAHSLWKKLVSHFGENHPILIEVDTLRRLQDFKRANKLPLREGS